MVNSKQTRAQCSKQTAQRAPVHTVENTVQKKNDDLETPHNGKDAAEFNTDGKDLRNSPVSKQFVDVLNASTCHTISLCDVGVSKDSMGPKISQPISENSNDLLDDTDYQSDSEISDDSKGNRLSRNNAVGSRDSSDDTDYESDMDNSDNSKGNNVSQNNPGGSKSSLDNTVYQTNMEITDDSNGKEVSENQVGSSQVSLNNTDNQSDSENSKNSSDDEEADSDQDTSSHLMSDDDDISSEEYKMCRPSERYPKDGLNAFPALVHQQISTDAWLAARLQEIEFNRNYVGQPNVQPSPVRLDPLQQDSFALDRLNPNQQNTGSPQPGSVASGSRSMQQQNLEYLSASSRQIDQENIRQRTERERQKEERSKEIDRQNFEYQSSLQADQAKVRLIKEREKHEEDKLRKIEERKSVLRTSLVEIPDGANGSIPLVLQLGDGQRIRRTVHEDHPLTTLYSFVYCHQDLPDSFGILHDFPRRRLPCDPQESGSSQTFREAGVRPRSVLYVSELEEDEEEEKD